MNLSLEVAIFFIKHKYFKYGLYHGNATNA